MTIRGDVTIDFELSPRVVTVAAPSVEITIQDLHDTLAFLEDEPEGHQYPNLISSAGKETLDVTTSVGSRPHCKTLWWNSRLVPMSGIRQPTQRATLPAD